ncbi:MAG TPA: hypothetical protein PKV75_08900 [Desulfobacterales bacterium]|nr:hypothetical protein [Desulfobacterales bacterium]
MGLLPIVEKGKRVSCKVDLPLFYMNDFSRLGLEVKGLNRAAQTLKAAGYRVRQDGEELALEIEGRDRLAGILALLTENRVEYEFSDLVSCVYQG